MAMVTTSPLGSQKHLHEFDNSDSDLEVGPTSKNLMSGASLGNLSLVSRTSTPNNSLGWIYVHKTKGRKDSPRSTERPNLFLCLSIIWALFIFCLVLDCCCIHPCIITGLCYACL